MPWVRLEENFADHPKVAGLTDGAFRLYVAALCYAARHLTDGYIEAGQVGRFVTRFKRSYVDELVVAGLWNVHGGDGWEIHDYLEFNPARADVLERREYEKKKKARQREGGYRAAARDPTTGRFASPGDKPGDRHRMSPRDAPGDSPGESPATRPDPVGVRVGKCISLESAPALAAAGGAGRNQPDETETGDDDTPPFDPEAMRAGAERWRQIREELKP